MINESVPSCSVNTPISACLPCDILNVSFGAQNCNSDLSYDVDVTINAFATGRTVKINDGTTDLQTGISATGTYTVSGLRGALSLNVIDEVDGTCVDTSAA